MIGLLQQLLMTPAWLALLVVFAVPALESSAFLGFVFPGETALLLGGVVASQGHVPLLAVVAAGVAGAIVGDAVGYLVGRRWGHRLLDSTVGRFVKAEHVARAEQALARRGAWAVLLGRFTVALRVMVPGLAGMARMPYRRFAVANMAGGVVWGVLIAVAGYLAGNSWQAVAHVISMGGLAATGAVVVGLLAVWLVRRLVRRRLARRSGAEPRVPDDRPLSGVTR